MKTLWMAEKKTYECILHIVLSWQLYLQDSDESVLFVRYVWLRAPCSTVMVKTVAHVR